MMSYLNAGEMKKRISVLVLRGAWLEVMVMVVVQAVEKVAVGKMMLSTRCQNIDEVGMLSEEKDSQ